jgi:hypothetical protein
MEPNCDIFLGDNRQISWNHFVVVSLGSGFHIIDASKRGTFHISKRGRVQLKKFKLPPYSEEERPKNQDMSHTLAVGDILQLGHKEPCQDAMGVLVMPAYEDAEFEILAGEGQCGTVDHSRAPANRKRNRDESCVDEEIVAAGRKSAKAFKVGDAARARRGEAKENMPKRRYAQVQRLLSKGQNKVDKGSMSGTQVQTKSQHSSGRGINWKNQSRSVRKMKSISFHMFNTKGKGKGKGKQGKGTVTMGKGKGKGKGRL